MGGGAVGTFSPGNPLGSLPVNSCRLSCSKAPQTRATTNLNYAHIYWLVSTSMLKRERARPCTYLVLLRMAHRHGGVGEHSGRGFREQRRALDRAVYLSQLPLICAGSQLPNAAYILRAHGPEHDDCKRKQGSRFTGSAQPRGKIPGYARAAVARVQKMGKWDEGDLVEFFRASFLKSLVIALAMGLRRIKCK